MRVISVTRSLRPLLGFDGRSEQGQETGLIPGLEGKGGGEGGDACSVMARGLATSKRLARG